MHSSALALFGLTVATLVSGLMVPRWGFEIGTRDTTDSASPDYGFCAEGSCSGKRSDLAGRYGFDIRAEATSDFDRPAYADIESVLKVYGAW
ncbi:hypothetical protein DL93DRAFT_2166011 [Clavulina sp. PMI_390]|nr:hypothetical protein DL93DRAFT_2166011 [Clavulina sp. PMI_390]